MLTFIKLADKEALQRPMAKGAACASGGSGRRSGRRRANRVLVISHFLLISQEEEAHAERRATANKHGAAGRRSFSLFRCLDM